MAKSKGTFAFNVKATSGSSAGFSNIPGASAYSVTFGKQFAKAFNKSAKKQNQGVGKKPTQTKPTQTPANQSSPAAKEEAVKESVAKPPKGSTGKIGSFKVQQGTDQVKTKYKTVTVDDIKNKKFQPPIAPENIPESYKPQGPAPSERTWSDAEKAALESERPKGYVDPNFKPEADTPENVARRRSELMEATAPKKKAGTPASKKGTEISSAKPAKKQPAKPKKDAGAKANVGQQFSPGDTSNLPAVKLD